MNLKEAYRYQNFLHNIMTTAANTANNVNNCLLVTKTHNLKAANPNAEDRVEAPKLDDVRNPADVIGLMLTCLQEEQKLAHAIEQAKRCSCAMDLDVSLEVVKFQRTITNTIRNVLSYRERSYTENGTAHTFNAEGNQTPYSYQIDVTAAENFKRPALKTILKSLLDNADTTSANIDRAQVDTKVDYTPLFNVNDTFDDVLADFIANKATYLPNSEI